MNNALLFSPRRRWWATAGAAGSGRRSGQAEQIMRELGYKNVTNQGGYEDLKTQGLS